MNRPHIGLTGFTKFEQVERMLKVWNANKPTGLERDLHVGAMTSYKIVHGIENKYQDIFVPNTQLANVFASNKVYNCAHYVDYVGRPDMASILVKVISFGGPNIHAVQLDMTWPDPQEIVQGIHASRGGDREIEIILQIGRKALRHIDKDPMRLVAKLMTYRCAIHRVLLDESMGEGRSMNARVLLPLARAIRQYLPEIGIGFAGGLGPDTMHLAKPVVEEFPDSSLDAQAALCPNNDIHNPTDWDRSARYLEEAFKLFR